MMTAVSMLAVKPPPPSMDMKGLILNSVLYLGLAIDGVAGYLLWKRRARGEKFLPRLQVGPVPWSVAETVAVVVAIYFATFLIGGAVLEGMSLAGIDDRTSEIIGNVAGVCAEMLIGVGLIAGLVKIQKAKWSDVIGKPFAPTLRSVFVAVAFCAGIVPLVMMLGLVYDWINRFIPLPTEPQELVKIMHTQASGPLLTCLVIMGVVLAPITEELIFRGFLYPAIKTRLGAPAAALIVSVVFSAMHLNGPAAAPLFLLSVGLILAYEFTGSLWTSVVLHMAFNSFFSFLTRQ